MPHLQTRQWPALVSLLVVFSGSSLGAGEPKQPMLGQPAPPISLESLEGRRVSLADFRGQIVVLHFGTGW